MAVLFVPSHTRLNASCLLVERRELDIIKSPHPDRKTRDQIVSRPTKSSLFILHFQSHVIAIDYALFESCVCHILFKYSNIAYYSNILPIKRVIFQNAVRPLC